MRPPGRTSWSSLVLVTAHGPFACVKALQQLNPAANFIAVVVEGDYRSQQAARRHCAYNGVRCTFHDAFVHGEDEAPATNVTTIRAIFDEIEPEVIGANLRLPVPHYLICSPFKLCCTFQIT